MCQLSANHREKHCELVKRVNVTVKFYFLMLGTKTRLVCTCTQTAHLVNDHCSWCKHVIVLLYISCHYAD